MIKIILSFVLIVSSVLIGNSFAQRLINRRKTLASIVGAMSRIKTLICFGGVDVRRVIEEAFCSDTFPLLNTIDLCAFDEYDKSFEYAVKNIKKSFSLINSDKNLLIDFGTKLGLTDVEGQVAHIGLFAELFNERLNLIKEQENSKTNLYRVLGFSLGCVITLIIV